jgi:hypothetical protein
MVPSPWPLWPETSSIHEAEAVAVQLHSRATDTLICPVPPDELNVGTLLVIVAWQRVAVGPVTLVTALPPHAATSAAHSANRRALTRRFTSEPNTRCAPPAVTA